jgi:predicted nucleotidyltransferase
MVPQLLASWLSDLARWAADRPEVEELYVYGSRVTGSAQPGSDLDVAVRLREWEGEAPFILWMFRGENWAAELQALLPIPVHLQAALDDDIVVWPEVQRRGRLVYQRSQD